MTDEERINWLAKYNTRLQDVYWRIENEGGTLREAIDKLALLQLDEIKEN